ncbi:MAG: MFS transporter [Rhabdochlamydiaceae bacterium]
MSGNPRSLSDRYRISILVAISSARIIYAINWYTLSPGLDQVATDFHASLQNLGVLESAFLVGAGLFQIPSSYAAARYNAKLIAVSGLMVIAVANGLGAFAPSFDSLLVLRFALGIGAAMFFSPAITLVSPLFRGERQGLALGIYNSSFSIGGALALLGWSFFVQLYGWRGGLLLGAILAGAASLSLLFIIRHTLEDSSVVAMSYEATSKAVLGVLHNKQIWFMGVGMVGLWSALYAVTQFLPFFETRINLLDPKLSGLLASLILVMPIPGALIGGFLSDRLRNRRVFMLFPAIIFGVGTALIGFSDFYESLGLFAVLGLIEAFAFTALYAAPFQMDDLSLGQKTIAISLMNSVQILGAFVLPILFTEVASTLGYNYAWVAAGVFALVFVPLLLLVKEPFKKDTVNTSNA